VTHGTDTMSPDGMVERVSNVLTGNLPGYWWAAIKGADQ
jgi:hypothetical protein